MKYQENRINWISKAKEVPRSWKNLRKGCFPIARFFWGEIRLRSSIGCRSQFRAFILLSITVGYSRSINPPDESPSLTSLSLSFFTGMHEVNKKLREPRWGCHGALLLFCLELDNSAIAKVWQNSVPTLLNFFEIYLSSQVQLIWLWLFITWLLTGVRSQIGPENGFVSHQVHLRIDARHCPCIRRYFGHKSRYSYQLNM